MYVRHRVLRNLIGTNGRKLPHSSTTRRHTAHRTKFAELSSSYAYPHTCSITVSPNLQRSLTRAPGTHCWTTPCRARLVILADSWYLVVTSEFDKFSTASASASSTSSSCARACGARTIVTQKKSVGQSARGSTAVLVAPPGSYKRVSGLTRNTGQRALFFLNGLYLPRLCMVKTASFEGYGICDTKATAV